MKRARLQRQPTRGAPVVVEAVQVFCRVRPVPQSSIDETTCIRVVPPSHLHLLPPVSNIRNGIPKEHQYTFSKVFDDSTSQQEIFKEVALPQVQNLLSGKNALVFTYGVTGSGKTYTMSGTLSNGGMMPRSLDVIFDSIADFQSRRHVFKPDRLNGFDIQTDGDAEADADLHERIALGRLKKTDKKNSDPDLAQRVRENIITLPVDSDNCYAVFITYVEIYNNIVYDLLEDMFEENTRIRPPQSKIIREDSNHNMFIHCVTEIEVCSTDEAFEAYYYGQKRRRIAQTALNAESSRSHSIFSIRLVQAPLNERGSGVDPDKKYMTVSQLSFVDLAGSERTNRTKNTGLRLKEAGNINNSLLTLRICLELLRENQNGGNKVVPYRDSRLTHLFKNYFDGDGQVSMVICISPMVEECEETMHVLKFAEMSQEITTVQTPMRINRYAPGSRLAIQAYDLAVREFEEQDREASGDHKIPVSTADLFVDLPDIRFFEMSDNSMLPYMKRVLTDGLAQVEDIWKNIGFESVRNSIVKAERDAYMAVSQMKTLEQQCGAEKERITIVESKLSVCENQRLKLKRKLEDAESTVKKLKQELSTKDKVINEKNSEQEKAKQDYATKLVQAQDKFNRQLERKLKCQKATWETEIKHHENKTRAARHALSELNKALPPYATPSRPHVPQSKSTESIPGSIRGGNVASVKASLFNGGTPSISAITNTPGVSNTPRSTARKMGVAVSNRRHRRSRSANDVWLEHRPVHEVPLNTLMQPVIAKRKSVTKLTDAKDVTEKTSKYCLLTQNQDSDGDLETRLYKGDVIPTSGGGAQVMFNDVEVLKQISPSRSPSIKTPRQIRQDLEAACAQNAEINIRQLRTRDKRIYE